MIILGGVVSPFFSFFLFSHVKPIERKQKKFNPLVIPKSLQAALPFASKPKDTPSRRRSLLENRRAVVMEPGERKVHALVQHLQLIRHEKVIRKLDFLKELFLVSYSISTLINEV